MIAALTGCAFTADEALWAAAADAQHPTGNAPSPLPYTNSDIGFFDEVAETILPRTDTPGAKDAALGQFIAKYSAACYPPEHIALLKQGISDIEARMRAEGGTGFREASAQAKQALLVSIDREAKEHAHQAETTKDNQPPHYFTLMKQLTLYGFFTSEPGATRVTRYRPVPGKYKGCIPYTRGQTFWAW